MKHFKSHLLSSGCIALALTFSVLSCNEAGNSDNQSSGTDTINTPPPAPSMDTAPHELNGDTTKFDSSRTEQNPPARRPAKN